MLPLQSQRMQEADLRRIARVKQTSSAAGELIGPAMVGFFKTSVQKRQTKFGAIAENWARLMPELLADHASLESFHRGTLTVLVDSAAHLYEIKQLLLAGIQQQLTMACGSAGLRKIVLRPGRWYEGDSARARPRF